MGWSTDILPSSGFYAERHELHELEQDPEMRRYLIERDFPDGFHIPVDENGARACMAVVESNLTDQVTWVHSYVSADRKKSFCIYDAPSPEAIRRTANRSKLPVGRITEVCVLDPYFYK